MAFSRVFTNLRLIFISAVALVGSQADGSSGPPDYLFVVETSRESDEYRANLSGALTELISGGLNGAMLDGQSFTVWSVNSFVESSGFPIRTWTQSSGKDLAADAVSYIDKQASGLPADWMSAVRTVFSAIKGAPRLNVILLSIPGHSIRGTPFDNRIDFYLKENGREMVVYKSPLIVSIKGMDQKIVDLSVSTTGEPVDLFVRDQSLLDIVGGKSNPLVTSHPQGTSFSRNPIIMKGDDVISTSRPDPAELHVKRMKESEAQFASTLPAPLQPVLNVPTDQLLPPQQAVNDQIQVASEMDRKNGTAGRLTAMADNTEVRARSTGDTNGNDESHASPEVATIGGFGGRQWLYLSIGISCLVMALAFLVLVFRIQLSRGPSLITEAYILNDMKKK